jgi:hypothetical protein
MRGESLDDGSRLGVDRAFEKASEDVPDLGRNIGGIQKPVIAAPKGTGFPVALLTQEDRDKIPLATVKPQRSVLKWEGPRTAFGPAFLGGCPRNVLASLPSGQKMNRLRGSLQTAFWNT